MSSPNNRPSASTSARPREDRRPSESFDDWRVRQHDDRVAVVLDALHGVELTISDRRIIDWLARWDIDTVETITSLFERARATGPLGSFQ